MRFSVAIFALLAATVASAQFCSECKLIVGAAESWLEQNATVSQITSRLDKLCEQVPGFAGVCENLVDTGVPYIIQAIETTETPEAACTQLDMCSASPVIVAEIKKGSLQCEGCEYIITAVESWAKNKVPVKTIEKRLDSLCSLVPGFAAPCTTIVNTEVPKLIAMIEKSENATVVCRQLKVCTASLFSAVKSMRSVECSACLTIFTEVLKRLQSGSTLSEVEKLIVNDFCNRAPQAYRATCDFIAEEGFSYLNADIKKATPQNVCAHIKVCPVTPKLH
eukprot:TRINITY_DN617_c0_g1_i1.p2 TRINITY_DN617_c0_g1~~TRINITY_DN617_c0_g1_i1.p2  ORF type:complete len:279 (-),score=76.68 TRINITY_DN617_c0_g1_i1:128-964(-)